MAVAPQNGCRTTEWPSHHRIAVAPPNPNSSSTNDARPESHRTAQKLTCSQTPAAPARSCRQCCRRRRRPPPPPTLPAAPATPEPTAHPARPPRPLRPVLLPPASAARVACHGSAAAAAVRSCRAPTLRSSEAARLDVRPVRCGRAPAWRRPPPRSPHPRARHAVCVRAAARSLTTRPRGTLRARARLQTPRAPAARRRRMCAGG
eukprot:352926-Chlamydomonas_euryale.AAC.4